MGLGPIIAHHEDRVRRHHTAGRTIGWGPTASRHRKRAGGEVADRSFGQVRLAEHLAVDGDPPVGALHHISWKADDTLDKVFDLGRALALRRFEHDDVTAVDVVEPVAQLVDEHAVVDLQGRNHRGRGDVEGLKEESLDDDDQEQRPGKEDCPLQRRSHWGAFVGAIATAGPRKNRIIDGNLLLVVAPGSVGGQISSWEVHCRTSSHVEGLTHARPRIWRVLGAPQWLGVRGIQVGPGSLPLVPGGGGAVRARPVRSPPRRRPTIRPTPV